MLSVLGGPEEDQVAGEQPEVHMRIMRTGRQRGGESVQAAENVGERRERQGICASRGRSDPFPLPCTRSIE